MLYNIKVNIINNIYDHEIFNIFIPSYNQVITITRIEYCQNIRFPLVKKKNLKIICNKLTGRVVI